MLYNLVNKSAAVNRIMGKNRLIYHPGVPDFRHLTLKAMCELFILITAYLASG